MCPRKESIIISDNALLYSPIICDSEGYPLQITNSSFEIMEVTQSKSTNRGDILYNTFIDVWNKSIPLTEELYNQLYAIE